MTTPQAILEAFANCQNPGEQIDLFENLAIAPEPPISAFYELLQSIRLESVVVLTIQAFSKISSEKQDELRDSEDLLALLSKQAQSGETDLIRWSAATAIEKIGYDFIAVSQYMLQAPNQITGNITLPKIKRFDDPNLRQSNDYKDFVSFWLYGPFERLRELSASYSIPSTIENWLTIKDEITTRLEQNVISVANQIWVSIDVMKQLQTRGLKEINSSLMRAEQLGETALGLDENELFEFIALTSFNSIKLQNDVFTKWYQAKNYTVALTSENISLWKSVLIHCLQSNSSYIRFLAARTIRDGKQELGLGIDFYPQLQEEYPLIAKAVDIFYDQPHENNYNLNFLYSDLLTIADTLGKLLQQLNRKKVREDCIKLKKAVLDELQKKQTLFDNAKQEARLTKQKIENALNCCRDTDLEIYNYYFKSFTFPLPPDFNIEINSHNYSIDNFIDYRKNIYGSFQKIKETLLNDLQKQRSDLGNLINNNEILSINIQQEIERSNKKAKLILDNNMNVTIFTMYILIMFIVVVSRTKLLSAIAIAIFVAPILAALIAFVLISFIEEIIKFIKVNPHENQLQSSKVERKKIEKKLANLTKKIKLLETCLEFDKK